MNPLLAQFLSESREQLEMTSAALLAMESQPDDRTKLGEIFLGRFTPSRAVRGCLRCRPSRG